MELVDHTEMEAAAPDYFVREGLRITASIGRGVNWNSMLTFLRVAAASPDPEVVSAVAEVRNHIAEFPKRDLAEAIAAGAAREVDVELATLAIAGMTEAVAWRARQDDSYDAACITAFLHDVHARMFGIRADDDARRACVARMLERSTPAELAIEEAIPLTFAGSDTADTEQERDLRVQRIVEIMTEE